MLESTIIIVGLGPGSPDLISQGAKTQLLQGYPVYFRTAVHPLIPELRKEIPGPVHSFDHVYESESDFASVYKRIVSELLAAATKGPIVYGVPGHPLVAEATVTRLLEQAPKCGIDIQIVPSMSGVEAVIGELQIDPTDGLVICDALDMPQRMFTELPLLITQVYSRLVASELKVQLLNDYDPEHPVTLVKAAGVPGQARYEVIPLYRLDQIPWVDHLTTLYVPKVKDPDKVQTPFSLLPLVKVMERLRGEGGCPWDQKQTHVSLKPYLIEETYEVLEAVDQGDDMALMEELGDVLLQVVFHAQIASERGAFDAHDIVENLIQKLIRRHPHVFGDTVAETAEAVSKNWEKIKRQEKITRGSEPESILDGIPKDLPALMAAEKLQSKAAKVGFEWDTVAGAWEKVQEEIREFGSALKEQDKAKQQSELGDILFALVNVARYLKLDPEMALRDTNHKFRERFRYIEQEAEKRRISLEEMDLKEMDKLWEEAKAREIASGPSSD